MPVMLDCVDGCAQVYTIYSILFIVFIILIIVTAFITVALTYFQLAVEDHRWWWRSVMCGGSTGRLCSSCHIYPWFKTVTLTLCTSSKHRTARVPKSPLLCNPLSA